MDYIPILTETSGWLAVDKPAGLMVHPADPKNEKRETRNETVVDWLLVNYPQIDELDWPDTNRPGIVHRLDTDTSGVILLAKTPAVLAALQDQFRNRTVEKTYQALVVGQTPDQLTMTGNISRKSGGVEQSVRRLSFSWENRPSKPAETELTTVKRLTDDQATTYSLVELNPKTGRTHQLRVQLLDAGFPIVGDGQYNTKQSREVSQRLGLASQFLHAVQLSFDDPISGERVTITSPLAADLQSVLDTLRS